MRTHMIDGRLPKKVIEQLGTYYLRVQNYAIAARLWDRLTATQRRSLGDDLGAACSEVGVVGMWMSLYSVGVERAVIDSAQALNLMDDSTHDWLLKGIGEFSADPEDLEVIFKWADLVIVEHQRKAYWLCQEIPIDWNKYGKPWAYFLVLVTQAKAGKTVDHFDFGENVAADYHIKMKSRLTSLKGFPADLALRIETAGVGAQTLKVPSERIRILCSETHEVLVSQG